MFIHKKNFRQGSSGFHILPGDPSGTLFSVAR